MENLRLSKILGLLSELCILSIVFFVPLYFALFLKTTNVFELNKIVLFKILVLVLLLLTVLKIIFYPLEIKKFKQANFFFYLIIPLFYLLILAVATLFSINIIISFFGSYARQMGLASYLYFILFFILLLVNVRSREQIKKIIYSTILASALVSIYGLVQAAGYDPLPWSESTALRATATFGQPNLLAAYLVLVIPFSAYLIGQSRRIIKKLVFLLILLLQLACLFYTYSLSGWASLIMAVILTGGWYFITRIFVLKKVSEKQKVKINKRVLSVILIILILIGFLIGFEYYHRNIWLLEARLGALTSLNSASLKARLLFWQASIKAIKERPWLGYGPESQNDVLVKYYEKDWGVYEDINVRPDRAHNLFLDTLLTSGIIGVIAYLLLLLFFFRVLYLNIKNYPNNRPLSYAILFALLGYLSILELNFTFVAGEVYFWLYLALAILIYQKSQTKPDDNNSADEARQVLADDQAVVRADKRELIPALKLFIVLMAGSFIFLLINKQIEFLTADYYARELQTTRLYNQYFSAIRLYEFIKQNVASYGYYDRQFAIIMSEWLENFNNPEFRIFGENKLKEIMNQAQGETIDDIYARAIIYDTLSTTDKNNYSLAEASYLKIITLCPEMPLAYGKLAGLYFKHQDWEKAIKYYNVELSKIPNLDIPNFIPKHKLAAQKEIIFINLDLGDIYDKKGEAKQAVYYYEQALKIDDNYPITYQRIAGYYLAKGDFDQAIWYNKKGMELEPESYVWPLALAKIYKEKGNNSEARNYANQALNLYPDNLEITNLLNSLK